MTERLYTFLRTSGSIVVAVTILAGYIYGTRGDAEGAGLKSPSKGYLTQPYISRTNTDRAVLGHVSQRDLEQGIWTLEQLRQAGERLFITQFTKLDGVGRPGATGNPNPTRRPLGSGEEFVRTAGPESNSCFSCHNQPSIGGAGSISSNVFSGLGTRHPLFFSVDPKFSSERNTPEINGSAAIELLAREMTRDLHEIKNRTIKHAMAINKTVTAELITKGISFGRISANKDGVVNLKYIEGVDRDLVVRPWSQKGTVTSLRTFTINALNLHHGMQARERFGIQLTGSTDYDRDGVSDELTEGDVSAMVVHQAMLNIPGRLMPRDKNRRKAAARGEKLFHGMKCASCHIPVLYLDSPVYTEPGPYNLEGTLRRKEIKSLVEIDVTKDIEKPRISRDPQGRIPVRAFTDLKRHRISDEEKPHFGNEVMVEGLTSTDEFITRRLWAVGNTAPYGHRGDITTIREAITHHGGEAKSARIEFENMSIRDQDAIVEFLQTLQILPPGSDPVLLEAEQPRLPYRIVKVTAKPE